ncbi:MAG: hypothetical protein HY433_00590 [Candidatus Liptonbacteria bacterium]|nr:hypothetical protein [Candidatus Liptonbacteria bacterium]
MKKQVWKNYFDIVILPPKEVSDYARKLSKEFSIYGTEWTLGENSFIPHISLYHIAVKPKNFDSFVSEVKRTIKEFKPGNLQTTIIEPTLLMFDKPKWIKTLHITIIKNTLKYYDRDYGTEDFWSLSYLPQKTRKARVRFIKKYGTPAMGSNFRPHVTLTSFKGKTPELKIRKAKLFRFKPRYLYVCELGPSHSCQRIVKKLSF